MKKKCLLWTLVVSVSLLMACGKEEVATVEYDTENVGDAIVVSSAEELFDAIEPGANIIVKKGTYDMTPEIEDLYGTNGNRWNKAHDYVRIEECFDGLQVVIMDVDGLTISGQEGKHVELQVEPRYADVFRFEDCSNITLDNMTIGHTIEQGSCEGDVLEFDDCSDVNLTNLDLYGCGTYGITSYDSSNITMEDSTIRECSYGLMDLYDSEGIAFKNCDMVDCDGYTMISAMNAEITFEKCYFNNNNFEWDFVSESNANDIVFKKCTFGANESWSVEYGNISEGVSFDKKCVFSDEEYYDECDGDDYPIDYSEITVSDVEGLLDNIAPNTRIYIEKGDYNLSDYIGVIDIDEFNDNHSYVSIDEVYDGYQVSIHNVGNLNILGATGSYDDVEIVVDPRYADVLYFDNCSNLRIADMTMGHTDMGECSGDVLHFDNCDYIDVNGMDLYGCGVYAIETGNCGDLTIYNSILRDCSDGPLWIYGMNGSLTVIDSLLTGSDGVIAIANRGETVFSRCTFGKNESASIQAYADITLEDCEFSN